MEYLGVATNRVKESRHCLKGLEQFKHVRRFDSQSGLHHGHSLAQEELDKSLRTLKL